MKKTGISIVLIIFVLSCAIEQDVRPTRKECIVGYKMDWSDVKQESNLVMNQFTIDVRQVARRINPEGTAVYFQFRTDCARKIERAELIIADWRARSFALPRFELMKGEIEPSEDTIDHSGLAWRD